MIDLRDRAEWRKISTAALVAGLLVALAVATYLAYYGAEVVRRAFAYQTAVVAAQRDAEVMQLKSSMPTLDATDLRPFEKLLAEDLARIDEIADTRDERAPLFAFPARDADYARLIDELGARAALGQQRFDRSEDRNVRTRDFSNVLFALVALLFVLVQGRLRRTIVENRSLVERLQRAFISERRDVPRVAVGSVLISATQGANVGGDVYDVFEYDGRHTMVLVADVSGKGVDAAVDTALIKFSIRTLFYDEHDPGRVLTKFGRVYARSAEFPETFVVLFLGVLDCETGELRYASAGHEPAFVRCAGAIERLPPTGPIIGIDPEAEYETRTRSIGTHDLVVVSTDGLTESRDARGDLLGADGVEAWLAEVDGSAQGIADAMVRRLRRRSTRIADDLAIVVLRYLPAGVFSDSRTVREALEPASARR